MRCRCCTRDVREDTPICGFCEALAPLDLVDDLVIAYRNRFEDERMWWIKSAIARGWYKRTRRVA